MKIRRGLGTGIDEEADLLVAQINELLSNQRWWNIDQRANAEERFKRVVVSAFYDGIETDKINSIELHKDKEERRRGRKGNEQVQDYLIPIIQLMRSGKRHEEVFKSVAKKLGVTYQTVSSQCTRMIGLSTQDFKEHVESDRIVQIIKNKYPDKRELIDRELG